MEINKFKGYDVRYETNGNSKNILDWLIAESKYTKSEYLKAEPIVKELAFYVYDENDNIIAGVSGHTMHNNSWVEIESLVVSDNFHRMGMGTKLLELLEKEAINLGCKTARISLFDNEPKEFYSKLGYTEVASIPDCPVGTVTYVLTKQLKGNNDMNDIKIETGQIYKVNKSSSWLTVGEKYIAYNLDEEDVVLIEVQDKLDVPKIITFSVEDLLVDIESGKIERIN